MTALLVSVERMPVSATPSPTLASVTSAPGGRGGGRGGPPRRQHGFHPKSVERMPVSATPSPTLASVTSAPGGRGGGRGGPPRRQHGFHPKIFAAQIMYSSGVPRSMSRAHRQLVNQTCAIRL
eukprot:CAMPEP_0194070216 /NCGR_PEP_ID=MMETSP0009_2-20130614/88062_1 /TAXON_ID=210454 /ORGANISM="Grammatophora oceanica, Strain CCMP 410" /LENGTH=122 /DNA_ID=CAMNT_0038723473 /DNA_START=275 /DNA_END=644 /DNA_ORIENTATION=-